MRHRVRYIVFDTEDADRFGLALQARFKNIRFVRASMHQWYEDGRYRQQDLDDLRIPYTPFLGDYGTTLVWIEPPGWEPFWVESREKEGYYFPINQPRLWFQFCTSAVTTYRPYLLDDRRMESSYTPRDAEHVRFIGQVWRLMEKFSTNIVRYDDPKSGVRRPPHKTLMWVGHHALAWCRADPARRICHRWRPADEWDWEARAPYL